MAGEFNKFPWTNMHGFNLDWVINTVKGLQTEVEDLKALIDLGGVFEFVNVEDYGAIGDGVTDDTVAINQAILKGNVIYFPKKHYKVTEEILFKHGQTIYAPSGLLLDGTSFIGSSSEYVLRVSNDGLPYTTLPQIANDIEIGQNDITFNAVHSLNVGDILCLYDNTEFSYSSARNYYKKSEFVKIKEIVSSTEVKIDGTFYDNYLSSNINFGCYKMNMGSFNIIGNLEVVQGKAGNYGAVRFERLIDSNIEIKARAIGGSTKALVFKECYNVNFNATAEQTEDSLQGLDYGLIMSNSQHMRGQGYFIGVRHGITHGGGDGVGSVVVRDCQIKGVCEGESRAYNLHGSSEDCVFEGVVKGGATIGGKRNTLKGVVYAQQSNGICVYFAEVSGFSHDFSGCKFISYGNPFVDSSGRGVIDFGGNQTSEVENMENGTLNFANIDVYAPNADKVFQCRFRDSNQEASGLRIINLANSTLFGKQDTDKLIFIDDLSGSRNYDLLDCKNIKHNSLDSSLDTNVIDDLIFEEKRGRISQALDTLTDKINVDVTYSKPYPSNYKPNVSVCCKDNTLTGTNRVLTEIVNSTNTGFRLVLTTFDGANFQNTNSYDFNWVAL